jgi:hypothetical protein
MKTSMDKRAGSGVAVSGDASKFGSGANSAAGVAAAANLGLLPYLLSGGLGALIGGASAPRKKGWEGALRGAGIGAGTHLGAGLGGMLGMGLGGLGGGLGGSAIGAGVGGASGGPEGAAGGALAGGGLGGALGMGLGGLAGLGGGGYGGYQLGKNLMWFDPEEYERFDEEGREEERAEHRRRLRELRRKPKTASDKGGSPMNTQQRIAVTAIKMALDRYAQRKRQAAVEKMSHCLTRVATHCKTASDRQGFATVQASLVQGAPLWKAMQDGFPKMAGEQRYQLSQELVKVATGMGMGMDGQGGMSGMDAGGVGDVGSAPAVDTANPVGGPQAGNIPTQTMQTFQGVPGDAGEAMKSMTL